MSNAVIHSTDFASEWQRWHDHHEQVRSDRHGFLAVTGLHFLTDQPQRFERAPGQWWADDRGIHVRLDDGEALTKDGERLEGTVDFGVIPERAGVTVGFGDGVIEIAKRGGEDIIRPRHPDHEILAAYQGTPAFAPDPSWVIEGRYTAYDEPVPTTVGAAVDGLQHVYDAPGEIHFTKDGQDLTLVAFPGHGDDLLVLLRDATSGVSTYAANRALSVPPPDAEGRVTLDFNRAINLPCAYTPYATCPLPPSGNRLPIAVEAGEKTPA